MEVKKENNASLNNLDSNLEERIKNLKDVIDDIDIDFALTVQITIIANQKTLHFFSGFSEVIWSGLVY